MSELKSYQILDKQISSLIVGSREMIKEGMKQDDVNALLNQIDSIQTKVRAFKKPLENLRDSISEKREVVIQIDLRTLADTLVQFRQFHARIQDDEELSP